MWGISEAEVMLQLMVNQSVNKSWCRAHCGTRDQILILSESCCLVSVGHLLWREVGCQLLSAVIVHCQFFLSVFLKQLEYPWTVFYKELLKHFSSNSDRTILITTLHEDWHRCLHLGQSVYCWPTARWSRLSYQPIYLHVVCSIFTIHHVSHESCIPW
jgi:hypothetical protein